MSGKVGYTSTYYNLSVCCLFLSISISMQARNFLEERGSDIALPQLNVLLLQCIAISLKMLPRNCTDCNCNLEKIKVSLKVYICSVIDEY